MLPVVPGTRPADRPPFHSPPPHPHALAGSLLVRMPQVLIPSLGSTPALPGKRICLSKQHKQQQPPRPLNAYFDPASSEAAVTSSATVLWRQAGSIYLTVSYTNSLLRTQQTPLPVACNKYSILCLNKGQSVFSS